MEERRVQKTAFQKADILNLPDVYSSPEKRHQLAQYTIAAWSDALCSKHIREMSWASESDILLFQQALLTWQ